MVDDVRDIWEGYRPLILEELEQRYLNALVKKVASIRTEFGVSYWDVETDRGHREFVAKDVAENVQWLGERRLMIVDVDGNRFEVSDLDGLDKKSAGLIELVL